MNLNPPVPAACCVWGGTEFYGEPRRKEVACYVCSDGGVIVVVFVCFKILIGSYTGGRSTKRDKETWLVSTVPLWNSGFHLQNQILINTSFTVYFSCFCQCRGGDGSAFIHLWPVSDRLLQKQNRLLKIFFILLCTMSVTAAESNQRF